MKLLSASFLALFASAFAQRIQIGSPAASSSISTGANNVTVIRPVRYMF
jgi:hypothetical protein